MRSGSSDQGEPTVKSSEDFDPSYEPRQGLRNLTHRDEQPGNDPEPDDDRDLIPARQLEVVLERGHPEDAFAGHLEVTDLNDHRERDDDEQATEDHDEQ